MLRKLAEGVCYSAGGRTNLQFAKWINFKFDVFRIEQTARGQPSICGYSRGGLAVAPDLAERDPALGSAV
jgi:hypothetical protein